jgi:hypothetical protein
VVQGKQGDSEQQFAGDRIKSRDKGGYDSEVAAASAKRPEQVSMLLGVYPAQRSVSGNDLGLNQVVRCQTAFPQLPSHAAVQRETRVSGFGHDTRRRSETVRKGFAVHIAENGAALDMDKPFFQVYPYGPHLRQVHDHPAIADGVASNVVPSSANRDQDAVFPRKIHAMDHVCCSPALNDQSRPFVDHPVPELPRSLVEIVIGQDQPAA